MVELFDNPWDMQDALLSVLQSAEVGEADGFTRPAGLQGGLRKWCGIDPVWDQADDLLFRAVGGDELRLKLRSDRDYLCEALWA